MGEEEGEVKDVSDQDSPTHNVSLGHDNSHPMEKKDDHINKEKEMDIEKEKNKEFEQEMDKENLSKDKEYAGEGLFLDNLKNLSEARLGFDRWTYEVIKTLEKNGKKLEDKRKKDEKDQKKWK